jgi:hypothetical protein
MFLSFLPEYTFLKKSSVVENRKNYMEHGITYRNPWYPTKSDVENNIDQSIEF